MTTNNDNISNEDLVVWLNETDEYRVADIQTKLQARVFHSTDECVDYITSFNDQKILLLISTDNTQEILSVIHTLEQVKAIYVLDSKEEKNEDWTNQYGKVKGIFTLVDQLSAKLSYDLRLSDERIAFDTFTSATNENTANNTTLVSTATSLDILNTKFMYFHILIDIFLKMSGNIDATSKQDMITYLTQNYNENEVARRLIDQFDRDYERSSSIRWYTKGTFLYRLLNRALRESDFDALFALRSFIVDLYKQILVENEQFRNNNLANRDSFPLKVYRGQEISREELNILLQKQGGYFSMQSFLSTSTNPAVAQVYLGAGTAHTDPNKVWILYEFKIDTHFNNTKPYARISHLSQYEDEDEVLVGLGAVFHIDRIQFDNVNQRYHALLSLCDDESFDLYGIMQQYAAEIIANRVSPGFLLYQQGNYVKAREYFQKILNIKPLEDHEKAHCYRGLGTVAAEENKYDEAYKNFTKEFHIWQKLNDEVNSMEAYKNIGDMLFHMGKFKEALEYLQNAAAYFSLNGYKMESARIYGIIGHIMGVNEQWENCLMCYEVQLDIREQILDRNHEDVGITHTHIGVAYRRMKKYEEAIEHFRKALDIYRYSYQPDHPNVLKAEENLRNAIHLLNEGQ